jgi:folate-binding Fe-S cluster repair protein YgfZ
MEEEQKMKVHGEQVEEILSVLTDLNILRKKGEKYCPTSDFDLTVRANVLKQYNRESKTTAKITPLLVNAMIDSLKNYGFFQLPQLTRSEAKLAVQVLFTFSNEKWNKIIENEKGRKTRK